MQMNHVRLEPADRVWRAHRVTASSPSATRLPGLSPGRGIVHTSQQTPKNLSQKERPSHGRDGWIARGLGEHHHPRVVPRPCQGRVEEEGNLEAAALIVLLADGYNTHIPQRIALRDVNGNKDLCTRSAESVSRA